MTLAELADRSGTPARTIRFYISRGILRGPVKAGRAAEYTEEHAEALERIKALQGQGRTLADIAATVDGGTAPDLSVASAWWHHALSEDVTVCVRADISPWRMKQVRAAVAELMRILQASDSRKEMK